ncbi:MAG: DNA mismatch endonuclease Vsr [Nitrospirae bacterium]|nr:DNA mismatch endonuclease Vsr [Nitrospirota bacterium]
MPDVFTKRKRSWIMARISGANTKPEILVRDIVEAKGFHVVVHVRNLPGNPDIVLKRHKKAIFVHGCFWHGHKGCKRAKRPMTNTAFWNRKINGNMKRDRKNLRELKKQGWKALVIWQCRIKNSRYLEKRIFKFLETRRTTG